MCFYLFKVLVLIEDTKNGKVERRTCWSPTKEDIAAELHGELIAWCYRPLAIFHGEKPKTEEIVNIFRSVDIHSGEHCTEGNDVSFADESFVVLGYGELFA